MLRNYFLLIVFCLSQFHGNSQEIPKPELIAEVEGLAHCESVAFDASRNNLYVSVMGEREGADGKIAIVSPEGKIKDLNFVSGLNNPKGIALTDDKLYVSDVTFLYEIALENGEILNKFTGENSKSLNDVAIDQDGNVYVSDMGNSAIYKLDTDGNFNIWFNSSELQTPNGLLIDGDDLYIAGWASDATKESDAPKGGFMKMLTLTEPVEKITSELGNLDGIQKFDKDSFLVSDWNSGNIYKISKSGKVETIMQAERSVGDILYVPEKNILALPMNIQNKLLLYKYE